VTARLSGVRRTSRPEPPQPVETVGRFALKVDGLVPGDVFGGSACLAPGGDEGRVPEAGERAVVVERST
jgi:hypothetical protein